MNKFITNSKNDKKKALLHKSFELGILIKGIDGILEILGGIIMIFLSPIRVSQIVTFVTQKELAEDPTDLISNYLVKLSSSFTINSQYFAVFYFVSHGLIKLILVILLWKRKIWAYPLAIVSLMLFIIYQLYEFYVSHSIFMIILTVFDLAMIVLTYFEYKNYKLKLD